MRPAERVGILESRFPLLTGFTRCCPTLSDSDAWREKRYAAVLRFLPPVSDSSVSMALEMVSFFSFAKFFSKSPPSEHSQPRRVSPRPRGASLRFRTSADFLNATNVRPRSRSATHRFVHQLSEHQRRRERQPELGSCRRRDSSSNPHDPRSSRDASENVTR